VKLEPTARKIFFDPQPPARQYGGVVVEERKIIHVTHVGCAQYFRHKMIEAIEIKVREELAGQVPYRQTAPPPERVKQIVAIEIEMDRLLCIRGIDDQIQYRARRRRVRIRCEYGTTCLK